jgi:carbonic anhydrase
MEILKKSFITNINISLSLDLLKEIYLLNHQDCGAIKEYLKCSQYP